MAVIILLFAYFLVEIGFGWLNFTYTPQRALNPTNLDEYYFAYTICIGDTKSYIHYDYSTTTSSGRNAAGLSVALGTTKPHIGGSIAANMVGPWDYQDYRYGNADFLDKGADAIYWGIWNAMIGPQQPYVFEQELNSDVVGNPGNPWVGNSIKECGVNNDETCSQIENATYTATYASITISRNNIEGNPNHTYQFNSSESTILAQWAYNPNMPANAYWYTWEHGHNTRGTFPHHFATQTVSDKKTLQRTQLVDWESGIYSSVDMAMEMDASSNTVTIDLWGPTQKWFGIVWGGHSQGDGLIHTIGQPNGTNCNFPQRPLWLYDYAVYGFDLPCTSNQWEGIYMDDNHNGEQSWNITKLEDDGTVIHYKAIRELISTDIPATTDVAKDVDFNINDDSMIFFVSRNGGVGTEFIYHTSHYWIAEVQFTSSGNVQPTQTWQEAQTANGENVDCGVYTQSPTVSPTKAPTKAPTVYVPGTPSRAPSVSTLSPTNIPSVSPTISPLPTGSPSKSPVISVIETTQYVDASNAVTFLINKLIISLIVVILLLL